MGALGSKHRTHAGRTADATAANKARFLKQIANGYQAYHAAERCHLAPSTVFAWKASDPEFAQAWQEAYELAVDKLEHNVRTSGMRGSASNAQFILKGRRKEVYGPQHDEQRVNGGNAPLQVPDQEHRQRLERLGLLIEMREGDYEAHDVVDVSPRAGNDDPTSGSNNSSSG